MPSTVDQINSAYRRMALQYHPDWNRQSIKLPSESQNAAIDLLANVRRILSDPAISDLAETLVTSDLDLAQTVFWSRPPLSDECMFCASVPSRVTSLTYQTASFFDRHRVEVKGPMCRGCGSTLAHRMQTRSLWTGWWGLRSFMSNLTVLFGNRFAIRQLERLSPPGPRAKSVVSILRQPMGSVVSPPLPDFGRTLLEIGR